MVWYLHACDDEFVVLVNDHESEIVGIGSMKVKMNDGIVKTFDDVKHERKLQRNLISLGWLDSLGYGFSPKGGFIKVSSGALVVMKGKLIPQNSYMLMESTIRSRMHAGVYCGIKGRELFGCTQEKG